MLCSAMATASLRPRLTELIVLIATAMPSGKLCAVRVIAVSSPTRSRRRSDADVTASARMAGRHRTSNLRRVRVGAGGLRWRLAAAELFIGLRGGDSGGTKTCSPSFLVASTVKTPEMDLSRVCFSPFSPTSL